MKYIFFFYALALFGANLLVYRFGGPGMWLASALVIPFDFVVRCIVHEKYTGARLFFALFSLTAIAAMLTYCFNAPFIALASVSGFTAAQIAAGLFYQGSKQSSWFYKVNISDLVAIIFDSIVFQLIAFGSLHLYITAGQIVVKFLGGLLWYYILFTKLRIHEKINRL